MNSGMFSTSSSSFGFDLHWEDVVLPLNEEINFVRRVVLTPITGHDFKKFLIFFIFIKVKVSCIFITASAELFQNPSLTHLTYTLQD